VRTCFVNDMVGVNGFSLRLQILRGGRLMYDYFHLFYGGGGQGERRMV
jgi:hypothetical protein